MNLLEKVQTKQAQIGVIGLGYVGLPLVRAFHKAGFHVTGFDIDAEKVKMLEQGKSYIQHIDIANLMTTPRRFAATHDFTKLAQMDCIIICVPTPLNMHREPDPSFIFQTTRTIAKTLHREQLIVLESTTYPGTTDEDMRGILEETGMKAGQDFYLAFSPEREDPNNQEYTLQNIPKVVGGYSPECLKIASALYGQIVVRVIPVSSTKVAEACKLLENTYRAVNIALVNELKMLFDRMGIDVWEVIEAAKTKPFGFQAFYPGPGLGGHCIPIVPFYLTWKAREYDFTTKFIELAGEVNQSMPYFVVQKTIEALNERGKTINNAKVLLLGLAYKKDIDDVRESPSFKLIKILMDKNALVDYNDPYIPVAPKMRKYKLEKNSVPLTAETLAHYDCVIIATDHSLYDPDFIVRHSQLVIDTRNVIKDARKHSGKVRKA